jgi:predicted nucleotidyltransferase
LARTDVFDSKGGDSVLRRDDSLTAGVRRQLPHLGQSELNELTRSISRLVEAFSPEAIYVFGSHARHAPHDNSDIDLLVLVRASDEPPYRRAQRAYAVVGAHSVALDIQVMTRAEFEGRLPAVSSLPATIVREGRVLYAAPAPA